MVEGFFSSLIAIGGVLNAEFQFFLSNVYCIRKGVIPQSQIFMPHVSKLILFVQSLSTIDVLESPCVEFIHVIVIFALNEKSISDICFLYQKQVNSAQNFT